MKRKLKKSLSPGFNSHQQGFTLLEVVIALLIFAISILALLNTQGTNLVDSTTIREELELKKMAEMKINQVILDPPNLKPQLTLTPDTKDFEDFPNFSYTLTWAKLEIPDFSKISGKENEDEDGKQNAFQQKIFKTVKDNMEKLIWQLEVSVKNKLTDRTYTLSTWIYNHEADIKIEGF